MDYSIVKVISMTSLGSFSSQPNPFFERKKICWIYKKKGVISNWNGWIGKRPKEKKGTVKVRETYWSDVIVPFQAGNWMYYQPPRFYQFEFTCNFLFSFHFSDCFFWRFSLILNNARKCCRMRSKKKKKREFGIWDRNGFWFAWKASKRHSTVFYLSMAFPSLFIMSFPHVEEFPY